MQKEKEMIGDIVKGKGTILLVDDEKNVLYSGEQMLKLLGYEVLLAGDGEEALEIYNENQDKIDIVLLDMLMPRMGGGETYDRMKEINPQINVILISASGVDGQATEILQRGCDAFIEKPFGLELLARIIRAILDKR